MTTEIFYDIVDWNGAQTGLTFGPNDYTLAFRAAEARAQSQGAVVYLRDLRLGESRGCRGPGDWEKHWQTYTMPSIKERLADAIDAIEDR